jgi:3-oxoacyl-[acyl-carrier protein] reductase
MSGSKAVPMFPNLTGKVVLVTGSSRGIGAAIARHFGRAGAKVAVHGRDAAALSVVLGDIVRDGGTATQVIGRTAPD